MLPQLRVALIAPEPLLDDRSFIRIHNKAAKLALRDEAQTHWKKRIPGHFTASAGSKYGYKERQPKYRAIKKSRYGVNIDLVASGHTRDEITRTVPEIRIGGRAASD